MPSKPTTAPTAPATLDTGYDPTLDDLPDDDGDPAASVTTPIAKPAAKPPVKDPTSAPTDGPQAAPKHSPRLVNMALSLGVPQAKIDAWDADRLEETVELLTVQAVADRRDASRPETLSRTAPPPAAAPVVPAEEEVELGFDTTGWDELTVKAMKDFARKQQEPVKALRAELAAAREREHGRVTTTVFEAIEDGFAALPAGYANALGQGELADVDDDAKAVRRTIVEQAEKDYAAAHNRPLTAATARQIKTAVQAAAKKLYGKFVTAPPPAATVTAPVVAEDEDELIESYPVQNGPTKPGPARDAVTGRITGPAPAPAATKSQIDEQVAKFRGGRVAVPTNRINPVEGRPGKQKAVETAAAYLAQMNGQAGADDE